MGYAWEKPPLVFWDQRRRLFSSALGNDLPVDLFSIIIIPLNDQHDPVAGAEFRVVVVEGIIAHDGHPIRQIAKYPATVLPCYHPLAMGLCRMPKNRSIERIRSGFFNRDGKLPGLERTSLPPRYLASRFLFVILLYCLFRLRWKLLVSTLFVAHGAKRPQNENSIWPDWGMPH